MANLNIHPAPGLGDLTSGFYVVPQNPLQMATDGISRVPSLGEFLTGSFVVPQNPFYDFTTGNVQPIGQGAAGTPMVRSLHGGKVSMGDLVRGRYVVPQNPFNSPSLSGLSGLSNMYVDSDSTDRDGCGCGGTCGGCGHGLGDLAADIAYIEGDLSAGNYMEVFSDTILGIPLWTYLAGAAILMTFLTSSGRVSYRGRR